MCTAVLGASWALFAWDYAVRWRLSGQGLRFVRTHKLDSVVVLLPLLRPLRVVKVYEAVAPYDPARAWPMTVRSRIVKERGVPAAREVPGEPNAVSRIEPLEHRADGLARYRLLPETGQTHQLRVHMAASGVPILGDPLYPRVLPAAPADDFRRPLQLLARELEFTDPVTGTRHLLRSARTLEAWMSYTEWAGGKPTGPVP